MPPHRKLSWLCLLAPLFIIPSGPAPAASLNADLKTCVDNARTKPDQAIDYCTRAIQSGQLGNDELAIGYVFRGGAWRNKGEHGKAAADLNEAVRLAPQNFSVLRQRGMFWFLEGDYDRAIADYSEVIRLKPADAQVFESRGWAWYAKGENDRALGDFDRTLELEARYVSAYVGRGNVYRARGQYDRALTDYAAALSLAPNYPDAYMNRGYARFDSGDFAGAATDLARAVPEEAHARLWLFLSQARNGKDGTAELSAEIRHFPPNEWSAGVAEMLLDRRAPQSLLATFNAPDDACNVKFYIAERHVLRKEQDAAMGMFKEVSEKCPKNFVVTQGAAAELSRLDR